MCSACHNASADSRVAMVSRRGAEGVVMGRVRIGDGGQAGGGAGTSRRAALLGILACTLAAAAGVSAPAAAQTRTPHRFNLPLATDLAADGAASVRDRVPILLFFDRYDCPYCERALAQYVVPMSMEAPWRDRAIYRQVEIDQPLPLVDFDGTATKHELLAAWYGVTLTPTVAIVDTTGSIIDKPVVGLLTADFYAAYLERAIDAGVTKLRGRAG
jgi:hypothetical protein